MNYFISDTHFWDTHTWNRRRRQFGTIQQMNKMLIDNWNSVVNKEDTVCVLGDFAICSERKIKNIVKQLNGKINLIYGNHDKARKINRYRWIDFIGFNDVTDFIFIESNNKQYFLTHKPFDGQLFDTINIHGHMHTSKLDNDMYININMDFRKTYKPITLKQIKSLIK